MAPAGLLPCLSLWVPGDNGYVYTQSLAPSSVPAGFPGNSSFTSRVFLQLSQFCNRTVTNSEQNEDLRMCSQLEYRSL